LGTLRFPSGCAVGLRHSKGAIRGESIGLFRALLNHRKPVYWYLHCGAARAGVLSWKNVYHA
jgi:hypothetical protein